MDMNDIIHGDGRTELSGWRNQQQQQQQPMSSLTSATMVERQLATAAALQQHQRDQAMAQRRAVENALINLPPSMIGSQQDLSATDEMRQILLSNNARGENLTTTTSRGAHRSLQAPNPPLAREARHHISMQTLDSITSRPPQMDGLTLSSQGAMASLQQQQQQQLLALGLPSARAASMVDDLYQTSSSSPQGLLGGTQGIPSSLNHQDFQQQQQRQSLNRLLSSAPTSSAALAQEQELQLLLQAQLQQQQAMNTMGVSRQQIGSSPNLGPQQLSALTERMLMEQAAARQRLTSQERPNSLAPCFPQEQQLLTGDDAASTANVTTGSTRGGGAPKNSTKFKSGTDDEEDEDDENQFEEFLKSLPNVVRTRRPYDHEAFPCKLYRMLQEVEKKGLAHIVSFTQSGKAFKVHIPGVFEKEIGPVYFRHKQYPSFRRQLSTYGFQRVSKGRNTGAFYHKLFRRDRADLLPKILRVSELRKDEQELLFPNANHGASRSGKARSVSSKKRKGSEHLDADGVQHSAKHSR